MSIIFSGSIRPFAIDDLRCAPFFCSEWLEKLDLEDRDEDDTVEYSTRATWIFNAEKSKGLTGHEKITVPHLFMLSVIMTAMRDKPAMISVAGTVE